MREVLTSWPFDLVRLPGQAGWIELVLEEILEWKCGWMGEWNGVELMVLRRRRGEREIVEVWMDGRIECRVLR